MVKNVFNTVNEIFDDRLYDDCLYEALNDIVAAKIASDAPKLFVRCYDAVRFGTDVTVMQIPYSDANAGGVGRGMEQTVIEDLNNLLNDEGFQTSFDQDGMEILLDKTQNMVSKFCEYAILLHPEKDKKLVKRIMALHMGMPATISSLN